MAKRSNKHWRRTQASDPWVARARQEGWRSRAAFKLMEIQSRHRPLRRGATVIDLGAAPGGWSQYAASVVGDSGRVIALDLLDMEPLPGVQFIRGDFRDEQILQQLMMLCGEGAADLVLSDMAPNLTGIRSVDQPRAMELAELALDLAARSLRPGGGLVVKLFHGEGFDALLGEARRAFGRVKLRKPAASRPESRETYLVASDHQV